MFTLCGKFLLKAMADGKPDDPECGICLAHAEVAAREHAETYGTREGTA